jgi:hypothetical protein
VNAYLGTVSRVDAAARTAQVLIRPHGILTRFLRVVSPLGLLAPPPEVDDEVLILTTGAGLSDAVVVGWLPTATDVTEAANAPLVASTSGSVPVQTDPSQAIGDAAVSSVLAR